jgi:hypothetical protein
LVARREAALLRRVWSTWRGAAVHGRLFRVSLERFVLKQ